MQKGNGNALRTRVYIDGYNLYYGCLKNSQHKWLDVRALIERILVSILLAEEAKRVRRSEGAARKWLNQPCAHLDGRVPMAMCESDDQAAELRDYMDRYAREFGV